MSYGDAELDMSSLSIACLCGNNGAGKSAILDAITWALWESARSSSDELIRLGQSEMWVDLVFELEGNLYRARRSRYQSLPRAQSKTTKGSLDFQVLKSSPVELAEAATTERGGRRRARQQSAERSQDKQWSSLTCASMRETQLRINEVLRMDYDTFINSVYLRQGRADEFTTRAPAERKQVLSEILGLSYFDRLAEMARDEARSRKTEIEFLQTTIETSDHVQEDLANARAEENRLIEFLKQLTSKLQTDAVTLHQCEQELNELYELRARLQPTEHRLAEIDSDIAHLQPTYERLRERKLELDQLLAAVPGMDSKLARFNSLKARIEQLDTIALQRQGLETRRLELRSQVATLRGRLEVEVEHLASQSETLREQRQRLMEQVAQRDKLQNDFGAYKKLVAQEAEMSKKQEAFALLSSRAEELHTLVVEARLRLEAELHHEREALNEMEALLGSKSQLENETALLEEHARRLDQLEIEFEAVEESGIRAKQEIDLLDQQIEGLEREVAENDQKRGELEHAHSLTMCPLCASPIVDRAAVLDRYTNLNQSIRARINECEAKKQTLEQRRLELRQRYIELKRELDGRKRLDVQIGEFNARRAAVTRAEQGCERIRQSIVELERKLEVQDYAQVERESLVRIKAEMHKLDFDPVIFSNLQAQLRMQRNVEMRYQQYKRDQAELARLNEQIPLLEQTISDIRTQLANNTFAKHDTTELQDLDARLSDLPYDRFEHDSVRDELAELFPFVEKIRDFDRITKEKPEIDQQFAAAEMQLQSKNHQKETLEESVREWTTRVERISQLESAKQRLNDSTAEDSEKKQLTERQLAVLETRIEQLQSQQDNLEAKQTRLNALLLEMNDFQFLSESFGKKGIQAVIIENAVPELESEANGLLARLTDNQMHIGLVTQQKNKSGNIQETLDILIADALGTRSYELYSGGEAFKINFAIRVALSRLLARRAGAKLQTLIIDEGFGSQDEQSRERLMHAINSIKNDFERIIVVTHIAEIKELFPAQIHVQKRDGLSQVRIEYN